jgi:hypothetical protein
MSPASEMTVSFGVRVGTLLEGKLHIPFSSHFVSAVLLDS